MWKEVQFKRSCLMMFLGTTVDNDEQNKQSDSKKTIYIYILTSSKNEFSTATRTEKKPQFEI